MMNRGIWAVFDFYFYFFRRKTNIELRYVSLFRFLLLLFPSKNQGSKCGKELSFQFYFYFFPTKVDVGKGPYSIFTFFRTEIKSKNGPFHPKTGVLGSPRDPQNGFSRAIPGQNFPGQSSGSSNRAWPNYLFELFKSVKNLIRKCLIFKTS